MRPQIDDLKDSLSQHLLDSPWDSSGYTEAHGSIRGLAELVSEWEMGDVPTQGIRKKFRQHAPGFDFEGWAQGWVSEGTYGPEMLEDWSDDEIALGG